MILAYFTVEFREVCIPRESGDDPAEWTVALACDLVFPARAGMIRRPGRAVRADMRIPRESGDDPWLARSRGWWRVYSPRERG